MAQGRALKILLVEDNDVDVKIASRAFAGSQYESRLHAVSDGEEALSFLLRTGRYANLDPETVFVPDLILLDINLPKMDGFAVLKLIKTDKRTNRIPVIMLTTSNNERDIDESYSLGAASYIQKSVSFEEFINQLNGFNFYWRFVSTLPGWHTT